MLLIIYSNIFRVFTLCVKYKYFKIRHDEICKDCCNLFFVIYDIKGDVIKGICDNTQTFSIFVS
jgi:hypothetical protein